MAKANDDWEILPHGPVERLAENLLRVEGTLAGMSLRRNMVVTRRDDGGLVIHSAISVDDAAMREIESLGTPKVLLVPNGFHRKDAPAWKRRFPALKVLAPAGSKKKVEQVIACDGTYDDFAGDATVRLEHLAGTADVEGLLVVESSDGVTLVFNDLVFNMDKKTDLLGNLFTTVMGSAPGPRVSRLAKLMLVKDKRAFRDELLRRADTPRLVRVLVAHEKVASGRDAAAALRLAATFL